VAEPARPAGYSGTPLAKKLGIRDGSSVVALGAPSNYQELLAPLPKDVRIAGRLTAGTDIVHLFAAKRSELAQQLRKLRSAIRPDAAIWVSWPKKAAKLPTDVTEDVIREIALPLDLVDVKVCAVDDRWSGLKLVIRKARRTSER
jgi:hypothetical protein